MDVRRAVGVLDGHDEDVCLTRLVPAARTLGLRPEVRQCELADIEDLLMAGVPPILIVRDSPADIVPEWVLRAEFPSSLRLLRPMYNAAPGVYHCVVVFGAESPDKLWIWDSRDGAKARGVADLLKRWRAAGSVCLILRAGPPAEATD